MFDSPDAPGLESRKFSDSQAVILQNMKLRSRKKKGMAQCHKPTSGIVKIQHFLNFPPSVQCHIQFSARISRKEKNKRLAFIDLYEISEEDLIE